jgi:hypothetical protein
MKVMGARLVFPANDRRDEIRINKVSEVEISTGYKQLTDRAEITLPRATRTNEKANLPAYFRKGDRVLIYLGYDGDMVLEFEGYITRLSAGIPIVMSCEDEMWKIKQVAVNYSAENVSLEKLTSDIIPGYDRDVLEGLNLGTVRYAKTTAAAVLEKIQEDFGLYSYMRGQTVVIGKYTEPNLPVRRFHLERNVVSNDLNYRKKEDVLLKISSRSILKNGTVLEYETGEEGGDTLNLTYFNITVRAELERLTKLDYDRRKRDGFTGSITAFGAPSVRHGQRVELFSFIYPDRNGVYYIDAVQKTFGPNGYRQEISIGEKQA